MHVSTTIIGCGITWRGSEPIPDIPHPVGGLLSVHNRGWWINPEFSDVLAESWIEACYAQRVSPISVFGGPAIRQMGDKEIAAYVYNAVRRYADRVSIWQVGNEVDAGGWLFDDCRGEKAGKMFRLLENVILEADPGATVIAPSIESIWLTGHGLQTLAGMLRGYGGLPKDVAVHVYTDGRTTADIEPALHRVWGCLESFGKTGDAGTRLWVTEAGMTGFSDLTSTQQGTWLRQTIRACRAANVHALCQYMFDNGAPGLWGFIDRGRSVWNTAVRAS